MDKNEIRIVEKWEKIWYNYIRGRMNKKGISLLAAFFSAVILIWLLRDREDVLSIQAEV